jgi:signal transduction histidine kinase/PAS domain-containing protein
VTTAATTEALIRDALDRLARQERRTEALETVVSHITPPTVPIPLVRQAASPVDTPADVNQDTPFPPTRIRRAKPAESGTIPRTLPREDPGALAPADVLASLDHVVWSVSPDGQLVFFLAGAVARTLGRPADHFLARPGAWLDALPPDDRTALRAALRHAPATDGFTLEHRVATPSGATRWAVSRGRVVRDRDGRPVRIDGTTTDVTARTGTDRACAAVLEAVGPAVGPDFLAKVVRHLASILDARAAVVAMPDPADPAVAHAAGWLDGRAAEPFPFPAGGAFVRTVLAGCPQFVPAAARDRFPADEFLARFRAEAVGAEPLVDAAGLLLGFVAVVDDRPARPDAPDVRAVLRALAPRVAAELTRPADPGEQLRALEAQVAAAEAETRDAREQLRRARRLETVGRLVAGVAHDFNNLLTVISGHAQLLRDLLPPADPLLDPADLIIAAAGTSAGVVRQLLAFARPSRPVPCPVDPVAAVRGLERMLGRLAGERVDLEVTLAPFVGPVRVDPGQFDQVLLNLVANARDAIADRGTVAVRVAEAAVNPGRPGWPADRPAGGYVALTVTDTGCGMADDVKARMFDPFFTTKGEDGTGLGLATVRDIVAGAGGHVEVESAPGWGTSVRVFWPKADMPAAVPARPDPPAGGETVLLVQADQALRDVSAEALQHAGYRVLEAADGDAGGERARLYAGPINLLVADAGAPPRDGREVAAVRAVRPGVKVLYVSGCPPSDAGGAFLAKPYTPADLLAAVRRALDTPG